jgi:hypothetical protein
METKSIFKSKTFWANVFAGAATYGGYFPAKYAAVIVPIANILLRLVSNQPVSVTGN